MQTLIASLPKAKVYNPETDAIDSADFHTFDHEGGLAISAEHGDDSADYYGEYRGGYPWINPALVNWADNQGGHWEWLNPGAIAFYKD